MKLIFGLAVSLSAAFILVANAQAHIAGVKLDAGKCKEAWAQASPDRHAILPERPAPYVADYNIVDMAGDGSISSEEFQTACVDGEGRAWSRNWPDHCPIFPLRTKKPASNGPANFGSPGLQPLKP